MLVIDCEYDLPLVILDRTDWPPIISDNIRVIHFLHVQAVELGFQVDPLWRLPAF